MVIFILRRVLYSIPVLFASSVVIFFLVTALGDPLATLRLNPQVSKVTIHNIEKRKHLNDSMVVQYGYWVKDAVTDGFGSPLLQPGAKIRDDLKRVMPHTFQLILLAELFAISIGIGIGLYSAIRQYSIFDYAATTLSFLGFAMPLFWLALMLQILFTNIFIRWHVRIFYTSGLNSDSPGTGVHFWIDRLQHLAIPAMCIAMLSIAQYSRFVRASMLEVVNSDYIRTARAKGLGERRITFSHALRNALIPLVTVVSLNVGGLLGGAVITESIFQLDGMGPYFLSNLFNQDAYAVMAWLMITATIVIFFNLLADVAYGWLDPRIRYD
jgi:ABC-type dipeptide/oligopeptide/nickel transport system permease component